jgi:hypothetical protein
MLCQYERLLILRHVYEYSIPIFNLANSGLGNSVNAMSSAMTLGGVPNDLIQNWNALTIVCCAPLINYGLYPAFSKMGYPISPMWRMTIVRAFASCIPFRASHLEPRRLGRVSLSEAST